MKQPQFTIFKACISLFDAAATIAQAFDFATVKHHTALDRIEYLIIVLGLAILSDALEGCTLGSVGFRGT